MSSSGSESQKAMRQPQALKVAGSIDLRETAMMISATSIPTVAVVWIQAVE